MFPMYYATYPLGKNSLDSTHMPIGALFVGDCCRLPSWASSQQQRLATYEYQYCAPYFLFLFYDLVDLFLREFDCWIVWFLTM
jgi:hypothetical protein